MGKLVYWWKLCLWKQIIYKSLCFAFFPHCVLFSVLSYEQTSEEMLLRLVLSVIISHYLSGLNAPREDIISHSDETEMDCESKRERQIPGGDSPHVPLHSCCQQQVTVVALCYLESLTQQGNSTFLHYDGFTYKCRGWVTNCRTCLVIL